jgi:structure-specific recognition protein 1
MATERFDNIHLNLSSEGGRCRFAETGFGWKPNSGGDTFTFDASHFGAAQWSRAARGYEIRILDRTTSQLIQLDGFDHDDYERLAKLFKNWYSTALESREHSVRGWNWGKTEFTKAELVFSVANRPAFEIPYTEISNTNLAGRNEVAIEFNPGEEPDKNLGGARGAGKKAGAGKDQLVEMRFYIPGTTAAARKTGGAGEDGEGGGDDDDDAAAADAPEDKSAATQFYETLIEKADIGETAGDAIASFLEVLHLTPRGRFDIDMYESSFRLRGKTYDYKIQYDAIKKFMVLPKPDDLHFMLCLGLDPPLQQGQTRYPFVVMQFKKDEEITIDLNLTDEQVAEKYAGKLESHYEQPMHQVVAQIFKGLTGKRITPPAKDFETHRQQLGIKCSIKASEGFLYLLEKSFMFVPKPATYIAYENTSSVTFSRVSGAVSALSTFDITVALKGGGSTQFSNISREEIKAMEAFFKLKGMRVKNEIDEDTKMLAAALRDQAMDDDDDSDAPEPTGPRSARAAGGGSNIDRGSADEDDESPDEDFRTESESEVAEEFDSEHESSGSGSDESGVDNHDDDDDDEMEVDDEDDDDDEERAQPPKKKKKAA